MPEQEKRPKWFAYLVGIALALGSIYYLVVSDFRPSSYQRESIGRVMEALNERGISTEVQLGVVAVLALLSFALFRRHEYAGWEEKGGIEKAGLVVNGCALVVVVLGAILLIF